MIRLPIFCVGKKFVLTNVNPLWSRKQSQTVSKAIHSSCCCLRNGNLIGLGGVCENACNERRIGRITSEWKLKCVHLSKTLQRYQSLCSSCEWTLQKSSTSACQLDVNILLRNLTLTILRIEKSLKQKRRVRVTPSMPKSFKGTNLTFSSFPRMLAQRLQSTLAEALLKLNLRFSFIFNLKR